MKNRHGSFMGVAKKIKLFTILNKGIQLYENFCTFKNLSSNKNILFDNF